MSIHRIGHATSAALYGGAVRLPAQTKIASHGFEVGVRGGNGAVSVEVVRGCPSPEQLLRLCRLHGVLVATSGTDGLTNVVIDASLGGDRYLFSDDLLKRYVFSRHWNRPGRTGVFYGVNPIVGDTKGPIGKTPPRPSMRNIVGVLLNHGPLQRIHTLNLWTTRTKDVAALGPRAGTVRPPTRWEKQALQSADSVVLAWGNAVRPKHRPNVQHLFQVLSELGKVPQVRATADGTFLTTNKGQPTHARMNGYKSLQLIDAPRWWMERFHAS